MVVCLSACQGNKRRENAVTIVKEWTGKEIKFPENMPCFVSGIETFTDVCDDYLYKEFKILLYVDSTGCSSCRLKLSEWGQLMEDTERLFPGKVGFLLFFQPKSVPDLGFLFIRDRFDYPVFVDTAGIINRLNQFPQEQSYQCFLLDSDNKVLSIGNPTINPQIWELYKSHIDGKQQTEKKVLTTLSVEKTAHDFGTVQKGSTHVAVFTITNTGNNPLVITRVSTACGCTNVTWEKQPIVPTKTTTVQVEMTPDEIGYFSKTVVVYCNVNDSPVKFMLSGITEI